MCNQAVTKVDKNDVRLGRMSITICLIIVFSFVIGGVTMTELAVSGSINNLINWKMAPSCAILIIAVITLMFDIDRLAKQSST